MANQQQRNNFRSAHNQDKLDGLNRFLDNKYLLDRVESNLSSKFYYGFVRRKRRDLIITKEEARFIDKRIFSLDHLVFWK